MLAELYQETKKKELVLYKRQLSVRTGTERGEKGVHT